MKRFNTTSICIPEKHYMVDLSERVREIKRFVDDGKYFTINRARQYGKTTTLVELKKALSAEYDVLFLDFQNIGKSGYSSEEIFVQEFCRILWNRRKIDSAEMDSIIYDIEKWKDSEKPRVRLGELFDTLIKWCENAKRDIVLIIDEVDTAANNQVFLDFLAQLREKYISRDRDGIKTFKSVILAGVTDIRHLRVKIRPEDLHKVNSPWNISADFDIDMSLSEDGIRVMLDEYESDHNIGMHTDQIAHYIRNHTNGYPYLVSRICEIVDRKLVPNVFENLKSAWTEYGIEEAIKMLLQESGNSLFDSLTGKLTVYPDLKRKLRNILMRGETLAWLPYDEEQQQLYMYGFIRNDHNTVAISNRIFERLLYTHFIGESDKYNTLKQEASELKTIFVDEDGWLDLPKIMEHFIREHNRIHGENTEKFLEDEGRERFITYVAAIINGTGTYDIEPQTRDHKRMDLVINYRGRRYIIELKIWHGDRYNKEGEKQILGYLSYFGLSTGYMLSFNFNKRKTPGVQMIQIGDKTLYEGIV